ncbi:hypothetical protein N7519_011564 [Penicillium mononematosum]|uniref:uncharacterized protein n=1 Tax=Penicillium mononematosum TaxID=268346 RepID=UPI00254997B6|nr:uncharacterized protein N7519_011564 [Penicillium mononematosum]KAJ6181103.1 hypothetical protein N7519_011564 [Penicillium mononematosum]
MGAYTNFVFVFTGHTRNASTPKNSKLHLVAGDIGLRGSNVTQQTSEEILLIKVPVRKRESVAFDREPGVVRS